MRKTKTCPKCNCTKLLDIASVADARDGNTVGAALAIRFEGHSFMGNVKERAVGELQAVTCSECGYTEFYCAKVDEVKPDGKYIRWLA